MNNRMSKSAASKLPLSKTRDLVIQNLEDELLIYDLKTSKAVSLNQTSAFVWEMCDGKTDFPKMAEKLSRKLKTPVTDELIWLAVEQLKKENLLENTGKLPKSFEGLSRREVIKKIGLASAVALPMICAIVAPTAANAQSSSFVRVGGTCSQDSQCASNNCRGVCCATATADQAPGVNLGVDSCRTAAQGCANVAAECCSGSASRQPGYFCFVLNGDEQQCVCDPYPV